MSTTNGDPIIFGSPGLANYPQARLLPASHKTRTLLLSGITARREDGTIAGLTTNEDGSITIDVKEQTLAVLQNIEEIIKKATDGQGNLRNVADATIFLTDLKRDYAGMNEIWNQTWPSREVAPARTCVGVRELPNEKLIVEFKVTVLIG